jgi:hypothetical protein
VPAVALNAIEHAARLQAINSTLDVETVLTTIVSKAVQLSGTEAGTRAFSSSPVNA